MIKKLLEIVTGKDDLERIAHKDDPDLLSKYLQKRRLLIPTQPKRFLDAADFTQDELMELIEEESKDLATDPFVPWVFEIDDETILPAFSSQRRMLAFSSRMSEQLGKVFSLGCGEVLLADITKSCDVDYVELNLFSPKSWEIGVGKRP